MGCMVKKYLMALFLCASVIVHAESFADESEIASDASLVENNATATFGADGNGPLLVDGNIKKIEAKNTALSKKNFNYGIHAGISYAMMLSGAKNELVNDLEAGAKSFEKWLGVDGEIGFALSYFFCENVAVVSGMDLELLAFRRLGEGEKIVYEKKYTEAWGGVQPGGISRISVNNQSLLFYKISFPVAARVSLTPLLWAELGMRLDVVLGGRASYSPIALRNEANAFDPFKVEPSFVPNVTASFGIDLPMSGRNIDIGLQLAYGLKKMETDYDESMNTFKVGAVLIFWM